ncbi:PKD domain-containing protein [candidate division KSB1 bacterium]|nr:PKD domain-containing protein [candidate division KSB1 bacterium]
MFRVGWNLLKLRWLLVLLLPVVIYGDWSAPIEISPGTTPDLVIDRSNGTVHVVYFNGGLCYAKLGSDGKSVLQEKVPGAESDEGGYQFSSTIALDTNGNPHVTYRLKSGGDTKFDGYYLYRTTSGWSVPVKLFERTERGNQMRMAIDGNNTVHILYPRHIGDSYARISYVQIKNGQIQFSKDNFTGMYEFRIQDHIEIDVSRSGQVYFVIGNAESGKELRYYRSLDGGNTWEGGFDIRGNAVRGTQNAAGSPDVFIDELGVVHFCYGNTRDAEAGYRYSVRYARWVEGQMQRDVVVSSTGELQDWSLNVGIGSVATSDDGKYVMIVYSNRSGGSLRYRISDDSGGSFPDPSEIASSAGGYDGRDKAKVRSYLKRFYTAYNANNTVYLRIYSVPGFEPPVAKAGGPYSGAEGTAVTFNASGSRDDGSIVSYEWDWNNDGAYETKVTTPTTTHSFDDEYSGVVRLKVTDDKGMTGVDQTTVNITNANPVPLIQGPITGNEGVLVNFSLTVTDPGKNDTHTFSWNFGDGNTSTQQNPSNIYADNGNYTVTVVVRDNDGGSGQTQVTANIANVAPTANAGGPYSGAIQQPVTLIGSGNDPAGVKDPLTFAWDTNNDGTYDLNGATVQATFNSPGTQTIKLRVRDDDGGEGTATTTVVIGTAPPVISTIPAQTVNEGTPFPVLDLDNYVNDLDTPKDRLTWSYSGNDSLIVDLNATSHEVRVTVPRDEWSGSENITFKVQDPDLHTTQATVTFKVNAVNDPPKLLNISDQFMAEDDTLILYRSELELLVTDPDNKPADFRFSLTNTRNILGAYSSQLQGLLIYGKANWSGSETATLKVEDSAGGSATKDFTVYVTAVPDAPLPFTLVKPLNEVYTMWPSTIQFQWNATTDPDAGDKVTYKWILSRSETFQTILAQSTALTTTTYTYTNTGGKNPGLYYWLVEATGSDGLKKNSTNYGVLNLNSKAPLISYIPDQTINEGNVFPDLNLDTYVSDADNNKNELTWRYIGNKDLLVQISATRVASVKPPNDKWYGLEQITFIVTDPTALSDSAVVNFKVNDVNAKPILSPIPTQTFDEDANKVLKRSYLESFASDEDNAKSEFIFKLTGNVNIQYTLAVNGDMTLFAAADWCGEESVTMVVEDGAGASASSNFKIVVQPIPDPPQPFDLVSPNNTQLLTWQWPMQFKWQQVVDPDPDDQTSYLWILSNSETFKDTVDMKFLFNHPTNYYGYMAPKRKPKGIYFWKLIAFGMDGFFTEANSIGRFTTLMDDVEKTVPGEMPKTFALQQNHPNPFNPETNIQYELPSRAQITLTIFNALGQKVRQLIDGIKEPGIYSVRWDATDDWNQPVTSGIYIYQLRVNEQVFYKKMILLQ